VLVGGNAVRGRSDLDQIQHNVMCRPSEDLCKLGKEHLNALICKFDIFLNKIYENFDLSHAFLTLTGAK